MTCECGTGARAKAPGLSTGAVPNGTPVNASAANPQLMRLVLFLGGIAH